LLGEPLEDQSENSSRALCIRSRALVHVWLERRHRTLAGERERPAADLRKLLLWLLCAFAIPFECIYYYLLNLPVYLPGKSHGQRESWWATVPGVPKESNMT